MKKGQEERREHIMLKLTESHPNNIFSYKDAHILTFYIKLHFPVGNVWQHICQHSRFSEGVFPNFRLSQVLVLSSTLYNFLTNF